MNIAADIADLDKETAGLREEAEKARKRHDESDGKLRTWVRDLIDKGTVQTDTVYNVGDGRGIIFRKTYDRECCGRGNSYRYSFEYVNVL